MVLTVLYVPHSLGAGHHAGDMTVCFAASVGDSETQVRRGNHFKNFCLKAKARIWP